MLTQHRFEINVGREHFATRPSQQEAFQVGCFLAGKTHQPASVYDTAALSGSPFMWEVSPQDGNIVVTGRHR